MTGGWWRRAALASALFLQAIAFPVQAQERPPESTAASDHFDITWVTDPDDPSAPEMLDQDRDGVPDGVERLLQAFERAHGILVEEASFREPPVEGAYHLFVAEGSGYPYTSGFPGGTRRSQPSFVVIPPRFTRSTATDVSLLSLGVHEYFHAIQHGYDAQADYWFGEATASWAEEIYLDPTDPKHWALRDFVPTPRSPLMSTEDADEYGAFLFLQWIGENLARDEVPGAVLKELWETLAAVPPDEEGLDPLSALDGSLRTRSSSLKEAWSDFAVARWRLGMFEEGRAYREALVGTEWPAVLRSTTISEESCRLTSDPLPGLQLPAMAADYVRLVPSPSTPERTGARLVLRGPEGVTARLIRRSTSGVVTIRALEVRSEGVAETSVPFGRRGTRHVTLALVNPLLRPATIEYALLVDGSTATAMAGPFGYDVIRHGEGFLLSGYVRCNGHPAEGATVGVTSTDVVTGSTEHETVSTDGLGAWSFVISPQVNTLYSAELIDPLLSGASSATKRVDVAARVSLVIESGRIPAGEPLDLQGTTTPTHPDESLVAEFRRPEGRWQIGAFTVTDTGGGYSVELQLPQQGIWQVRTRMTTSDADHVPGWSEGAFVEVVD